MTDAVNYPQYIKTLGASTTKTTNSTIVGRDVYVCANKDIVNGLTSGSSGLTACLAGNTAIRLIARSFFPELTNTSTFVSDVGALDTYVTKISSSTFLSGVPLPYTNCTLAEVVATCHLITGCGLTAGTPIAAPDGFLFNPISYEQDLVQQIFGADWQGCFWINPQAPYSTGTIDAGPNYSDYLKLRLTTATFWNTPKDVPVKRDRFMFSANTVIQLGIAGDFSLRCGDIVFVDFNNIAKATTSAVGNNSFLTGHYYVVKVRHTFSDDMRLETTIFVTSFLG